MLTPYGETRSFIVREEMKQGRRGRRWSYRLFSELEPDPYLAVVLGDLLYDVRSALDHVAVALVPSRRKYRTSFPILTIDPQTSHPGREKASAAAGEVWRHCTTGMNQQAVEVLRSVQPYTASPPAHLQHIPLGPDDHALALLSAFQNADKHRQLITVADALDLQSLSIRDKTTGQVLADDNALRGDGRMQTHIPKNGALIRAGKTRVSVQASGATFITVRTGNAASAHRRLPDFPQELINVAGDAIARLAVLL
jgi:hypothetical protein